MYLFNVQDCGYYRRFKNEIRNVTAEEVMEARKDVVTGVALVTGENLNYKTEIDLFTDSDAILNFCPLVFCVKWALYFVSTSNIMKGCQFSKSFDFRKLCNMSVEALKFPFSRRL